MDYFNHQRCKMFISSILKRFLTCDDSDPETFLTKGPKRHFGEILPSSPFVSAETDTHVINI